MNTLTDINDERGAIYTRREVVEFILDLVGYVENQDLGRFRLLEPSAGHANFLIPIIGRLVRSYLAHGGTLDRVTEELSHAIRAYEIHQPSIDVARTAVKDELLRLGVAQEAADALAQDWLIHADFLTTTLPFTFDFVVGNPPYVRQELIDPRLLLEYRARFKTLYDRADLYIPFYEHCLNALSANGRLGFICTDRWTKNKYGGPLRSMVSEGFALTHYVDLMNTSAFLSEVATYPAITAIQRAKHPSKPITTRIAHRPTLSSESLETLAQAMTHMTLLPNTGVTEMTDVVNGAEPWILHQADRLALVRRLEESFPTLEQAGCKVGIGVATGNDSIYIDSMDALHVEPSRKLPLVRTQDLRNGGVEWQGKAVLNPFESNGQLVDLALYPKFAAYLDAHQARIKSRHVAKKNPDRWFRTIDRIYPELASTPKLLVPDIKGDAHIVYEDGRLYPHHNLYFITSAEWDLRALQAVLMSGMARLFISTYSTAMRGGALRFQAQYLRRIRIPYWKDVPTHLQTALREAAIQGNLEAAILATHQLYALSETEQHIVTSTG